MVVNPFFLHGSTQEQNLQQDLINEQIRMYGMDVYYIPRTFIREATIMREVTSSAFRSYFTIEAYLNNFDGYGGQGDIMSKFGIQVKDEVTLTISRERYENYIAPFLNSRMQFLMNSQAEDGSLPTIQRPREGDLIYFPLGRRLFEIKFVEHEQPFYQLGKGYTYELQCELFEYEDEVLETSIDEIDSTIQKKGFINTLKLIPVSNNATATAKLGTGYIRTLELLQEGTSYTSAPDVVIAPPQVGEDPSVVALLSQANTNIIDQAVKQLVMFNSGSGYTQNPRVSFANGGGRGAEARAIVNTESKGVIEFEIVEGGVGYPEDVDIVVYNSQNIPLAYGKALTNGDKIVSAIITDPGEDLPDNVSVVVSAPPGDSNDGIFQYNEIVKGEKSGTQARVRGWDQNTYELEITNIDPTETGILFLPGEFVVGQTSGARYALSDFNGDESRADRFSQNEEIQTEAREIVDDQEFNQFFNPNQDYFDQDNPFGEL